MNDKLLAIKIEHDDACRAFRQCCESRKGEMLELMIALAMEIQHLILVFASIVSVVGISILKKDSLYNWTVWATAFMMDREIRKHELRSNF